MPKFISQKKTSQTSSKYSKSIAHVKKKPQAKIKIPSPVSESQNSDTDENLEGPNSEVDLSEEGNDEDMDVDQNEAADSHKTSKSGSTRESHQSQRLLQAQRKATKPNSALLTEAKRVWATARKIDLPKAERQASIQELMRTVRGKVKEIVFKHDASRIIQTLVRYGGQEERNEVAEELKGSYVELSQNKYSKFLVIKLIRYCSLHRSSILSEFHGHVLRLLLHREASQIISDAFELYASSSDRSLLIRDFYGKEVSLFDSSKLRGEQNGKSGGLATVLNGVGSDRRKRVLTSLKDNLMNMWAKMMRYLLVWC
ncbi:pumilio domain member 6 [Tulasnella sp. 419]|nr:pumilio domain member 6 [Tulasnella sp. 419]